MQTLALSKMLTCTCTYFNTYIHYTVVSLAFRPDGLELAVSSLDGQISFWDILNTIQTGTIEGRHDLHVGRRETDKVTAKKLAGGV